jgi:hypothetical protein
MFCSFFCLSKKTNQKKDTFFVGVFSVLLRAPPKNRKPSAKFSPRLRKFLTQNVFYTGKKRVEILDPSPFEGGKET